MDEWAGSEELITALLQDPLASTDEYNAAIRERWGRASEGQETLLIEWVARSTSACLAYTYTNTREGSTSKDESASGTLRVPSSWFQRFSHPTQLLEYPPAPSAVLDRILLKADIPILLLNPLTTPPSSLLKHTLLTRNPNAIIIISTIPSSPEAATHIRKLISSSSSSIETDIDAETRAGAKVIFVDPHLALRALSTLASDPKNARNVQAYQHDYTLSNLSLVTASIDAVLAKFPATSKPGMGMIRAETALTRVRLALEACRAVVRAEERDLDAVFLRANELRGLVEEARARAHAEVLGAKAGEPEVAAAMKLAAGDMKAVMDHLTWWRMLGRVDEIGLIVGNAVRRVWCKDLETKVGLTFQIESKANMLRS